MKRGPIIELEDTRPSQKLKIEKSLEILLQEVSTGNYEDFQAYLIQKNIINLELFGKAKNIDLTHLGQALKGTNVTTLGLAGNNISDDGAKKLGLALKDTKVNNLCLALNQIGPNGATALGVALKDTNVTTLFLACNGIGDDGAEKLGAALRDTNVTRLYISLNRIGPNGAAMLAKQIPYTLLVDVSLGFQHEEFEKALKNNRWKLQHTPYCIASLAQLPQEQKEEYINLPKLNTNSTNEEQLKFAGGIFMALGKIGCTGLQKGILSFLPTVTPFLATQYPLATAQAEKRRRAKVNMDVEKKLADEDMIIENSPISIRPRSRLI